MSRSVENFYAQLGRQILAVRSSRGWTQLELGRKLNPPTTRASIANIEKGKQRVLAHSLFQLADALEIEVVELAAPDRLSPKSADQLTLELENKLSISKEDIQKILTMSLDTGQTRETA